MTAHTTPALFGTQTIILCSAALLSGLFTQQSDAGDKPMVYKVARVKQKLAVSALWNSDFWREVEPLSLTYFMGAKPEHFPKVQAKLAYDDKFLYVIFQVDDRYVRAVAQKYQDAVFRDSCVEFFFTPSDDVAQGYFNLEMNCGGTMLFYYQRPPSQTSVPISGADVSQIKVLHSLPKIIDPEITEPTQWTVAYRLPIAMFSKYFSAPVQQPAPGITWRANLFKCADGTSHPHWLTWSPVNFAEPDFHRPQSFGSLMFE